MLPPAQSIAAMLTVNIDATIDRGNFKVGDVSETADFRELGTGSTSAPSRNPIMLLA